MLRPSPARSGRFRAVLASRGRAPVGSCVGARADRAEARTGLSDARWRTRPPERIGDGVVSGGAHSFRVLSKVQTLITVGQFQLSWELQCKFINFFKVNLLGGPQCVRVSKVCHCRMRVVCGLASGPGGMYGEC